MPCNGSELERLRAEMERLEVHYATHASASYSEWLDEERDRCAERATSDVWVTVERGCGGWFVVEQIADTRRVGGPFPTRAFARQVAEGARMMAERLAADPLPGQGA